MTGFQPRKRFGQHFLVNESILDRIVQVIRPQVSDHMVEIGPGLGAMTRKLVARVGQLDAVELDRDLIPILQTEFATQPQFHLHEGDALRFDIASLRRSDELLRVVGNLPYQISTPLLFHLLSFADQIQDMHFMLQKEVVQRMCAKVGSQHYGRLSVMTQYYCMAEALFMVRPGAFRPPPRVDSQIVRLIPYKRSEPALDVDLFSRVVHDAFGQRRKMLRNSLKSFNIDAILNKIGLEHTKRAEELSVTDYVTIANELTHFS